MIIFARTIKHFIFKKYFLSNKIIASVSVDNEVYLEIGDGNQQGIILPSQDAIALAEAMILAANGRGVPAGEHTPGTSDE